MIPDHRALAAIRHIGRVATTALVSRWPSTRRAAGARRPRRRSRRLSSRSESQWTAPDQGSEVRTILPLEGGRWIRTFGAWRQAVGPVTENVKTFADACRQAIPPYGGCKVPRSRKREHGLAPLSPCGPSLILGVELPLDAFFGSPGPRRGLSAGDQRFKSVSLQRRVTRSRRRRRAGLIPPRSNHGGHHPPC
jgi:hypothetical protein